ncbi:MAG: hypothetical protein F6K62_22530 [Sphaerospermopsis sp. SIO1G2]|nr:hypothetical protein [Sphaerospermopsis sp. SIO1G2]
MHRKLQPQQLAEAAWHRTIDLLPNSHLRFTWDWYVFDLRTADLIVLNNLLTDWLDYELDYDTYQLQMGAHHLVLAVDDLQELQELVADSVAQLPRQLVRWIDIAFELKPLDSSTYMLGSRFSHN